MYAYSYIANLEIFPLYMNNLRKIPLEYFYTTEPHESMCC